MVDQEGHAFTERQVRLFHELHATILWLTRGKIVDDDVVRMDRDWLDARRLVGFRLADDILNGCKTKTCYSLPAFYFPYLSSLTLREFKLIKAYLMWEKLHNRVTLSENEKRSVFLESCGEIEQYKINCKCDFNEEIPEDVNRYLIDAGKNSHFIIRRKAYWNRIFENNTDEMHNWKIAEDFVNAIYKGFQSWESLTQKQVIRIVRLIDENHHLTNMFEYVIRCYFFKYQGLTRNPSDNDRSLICCARSGELILEDRQ